MQSILPVGFHKRLSLLWRKLKPTDLPKSLTIRVWAQGPLILSLVSLESFTATSPYRRSKTSSSYSASASNRSKKSKAFAKAPRISPTSFSLKEALADPRALWWLWEWPPSLTSSLKSAWWTSFTFFLLRESSTSSYLESTRCLGRTMFYLT